jgi:NAD(P)H-hydrate epimerase
MKLVTVAEMRAIEQEANAQGITYERMMENAGHGVAQVVLTRFGEGGGQSVIGLVGSGNNGGDTLVALAELAHSGWQARCYIVRPRPEEDSLVQRLVHAGGEVMDIERDKGLKKLDAWLGASDVLLDGVLGTGVQLPLKPELARLLGHVKNFRPLPFVVAVDCPSGMDCDSGEVAEETIPANVTVSMAAVKMGMLRFPAFEWLGQLEVADIGLSDSLKRWKEINLEVVTGDRVRGLLPKRPGDAHKGTFGTAMVIAGSVNYTGAAYLAAKAAYRVGAGLVRVAMPGPIQTVLAGPLPEATWLLLPHELGVIARDGCDLVLENLERVTALLLGPGWGLEETTREFLSNLLSLAGNYPIRSTIGFVSKAKEEKKQESKRRKLPPLVIDADGLKLLSRIPDWDKLLPEGSILTPHPGEMGVLTGMAVPEIQKDRLTLARRYAEQWKQVVVLKGALSVVAAPDGRAAVIPVATPALARAGTGDVLSGIVVGLLAQGVPAYEAALTGAWLHAQAGLAASDWVGHPASVLAGDVLEAIADVLQSLESKE